VDPKSGIRRLRQEYTDQLLTLLALLLALEMFVFSPLQAMGIFAFQGFVVATLLAIMAGMLIISDRPTALAVMSICFAANIVVLLLRFFYPPWPYNTYILAVAWFAIAVTLGAVVTQAVFRRGRVTYHRIIGAVLLYLLIAVAFGALFVLVGLSVPEAFKGITFEDNPALANSVAYLSFVTLTSTGYGDLVPLHPIARSLCNIESIIGQLYPATLLARLVTLEMRQAIS
jgi:Ion channel